MFYLACTGTVQRPVVWLYHTLVWNLLFCRFFCLGHSKPTRFAEIGGIVSSVVAGVNLKACFKLHRETSTVIGCL
jgi:hypothetical protein